MKSRFFMLMLLIATAFSGMLPAQNAREKQDPNDIREEQQYRLAQRYQRNSQFDYVIQILKPLLQKRPEDVRYYAALLDAYLKLKQFDNAFNLVDAQVARFPENPRYIVDAGDVRYKSGDQAGARKIWSDLLKKESNDISVYTLLANAYIDNRLYDDTVTLYRDAIKKFPDKSFLVRSLADFHRQRLEFRNSLDMYLQYIELEPQNFQSAARAVLSFELENAQIDTLSDIFEQKIRRSKEPQVQLLAAKFFQKHKRYDQALSILESLETDQSSGRYLEEFARTARSDSSYALALRAYQRIIERFPKSNLALTAYLGAAQCNLLLAHENSDQKYARQTIDMIKQVQQKYPDNANLGSLALLEGDVYRDFFFDLDRAIDIYNDVAKHYANHRRVSDEAQFKSGESYMMRGDLDRAEAELDQVGEGAMAGRALLLKARIAMYRNDFDTANELIGQVLGKAGIEGEETNDALALQTLLVNQSMAPDALKFYVAANWLLFQQKKSEAITQLQKALDTNPPAHFRVKILLEAARLAESVGKFPDALEYCNRVVQDAELNLYADEALFIMAAITDKRLNDVPQAFRLYDQILADFPNSQFAIPARDRLRKMRVQYPELVP